jgi:VanZ family protein
MYEINSRPEVWIFILSASAICVGCLLPARWMPRIENDKLAHFLAFGVLTILAKMIAATSNELIFWVLGIGLAGLLIEILQKLVPGRNFCWRDMFANLAGIFVAVILCVLFDVVYHAFFGGV